MTLAVIVLDPDVFLRSFFSEVDRDVSYRLGNISPEIKEGLDLRLKPVFDLVAKATRSMLSSKIGIENANIQTETRLTGKMDECCEAPIGITIWTFNSYHWYDDGYGPNHPDIFKRTVKQKRVACEIAEDVKRRSQPQLRTSVRIFLTDGAFVSL
jgi:hypothetical protein